MIRHGFTLNNGNSNSNSFDDDNDNIYNSMTCCVTGWPGTPRTPGRDRRAGSQGGFLFLTWVLL